ncbi:uncharacterized protein SRS1_10826 [Sporisorium reilianum f. sp. reilianum]|uniref:Uncharacterized protein n=1 Tax=Sporisorium reilianum f. sp. reilianum TaxID=72559 RepID=A0A2N8UN26_9BASI|nr:uncharacterized protein SRS1_10826 [Sporisorium reilianum f. sp. reilianum]
MVFQSYGFESTTYSPINMGHASISAASMPLSGAGCSGNRKRKALDDLESFDAVDGYQMRPKLSLPRSAGLVFNGEAQFHPLPAHVNQEMLAQLGHSPFAGAAPAASYITPSSSSSSLSGHNKSSASSDYFGATMGAAQYPEVEPYPSTSPSGAYGILGPAPGGRADSDGMDVDGGSSAHTPSTRVHGAHCKSIPQLCVRYNDGAGSELWATCPDCRACSKVDSSQPSANLCYSP